MSTTFNPTDYTVIIQELQDYPSQDPTDKLISFFLAHGSWSSERAWEGPDILRCSHAWAYRRFLIKRGLLITRNCVTYPTRLGEKVKAAIYCQRNS